MLIMWTILGNGEELRHLNHQEDWLKTVVVSEKGLLSTTNADGTNIFFYKCRTTAQMRQIVRLQILLNVKCGRYAKSHAFYVTL